MSSVGGCDSLPADVAQLDIHGAEPDIALDTDTGMVSQPARTPTNTPALHALRALLRQTMRVTILDGRIFLGTFAGTDKLLNILLVNTDEFVLPHNSRAYARANPNGRFVGLVQIPWKLVVKAEVLRAQQGEGSRDEGYGAADGYPQDDMLYA